MLDWDFEKLFCHKKKSYRFLKTLQEYNYLKLYRFFKNCDLKLNESTS